MKKFGFVFALLLAGTSALADATVGLEVSYDKKSDDYVFRLTGDKKFATQYGEIRVAGGLNFDQTRDTQIDDSQLDLQVQYLKEVIASTAFQIAVAAGTEAESEVFQDIENLWDQDALEASSYVLAVLRFELLGAQVSLTPGIANHLTNNVIRTVRDGTILLGSVTKEVLGKNLTVSGGMQEEINELGEKFKSPEAGLALNGNKYGAKVGWDREEWAGEKVNRYTAGLVMRLGK